MIEIGKINTLIIKRQESAGFYLQDSDGSDEVFMPNSMSPESCELEKELSVFIYITPEGSRLATSGLPHAQVGEYAILKSVEVQDFGAFFDFGINKDLLVPGNEQKYKVEEEGEEHLLRICLEEDTNRIFGTSKIGKYVKESVFDIEEGSKVKLVPIQKTDLGYRVIVNRKFIGMIYQSEIFKPVVLDEVYNGYVKKLREDGLVDCALQIQGIKNLDAATVKIIDMLRKRDGKSALNDKSSPEEIKNALGMSKKSFKNAIGMLYKKKRILIKDDGIELIKKL